MNELQKIIKSNEVLVTTGQMNVEGFNNTSSVIQYENIAVCLAKALIFKNFQKISKDVYFVFLAVVSTCFGYPFRLQIVCRNQYLWDGIYSIIEKVVPSKMVNLYKNNKSTNCEATLVARYPDISTKNNLQKLSQALNNNSNGCLLIMRDHRKIENAPQFINYVIDDKSLLFNAHAGSDEVDDMISLVSSKLTRYTPKDVIFQQVDLFESLLINNNVPSELIQNILYMLYCFKIICSNNSEKFLCIEEIDYQYFYELANQSIPVGLDVYPQINKVIFNIIYEALEKIYHGIDDFQSGVLETGNDQQYIRLWITEDYVYKTLESKGFNIQREKVLYILEDLCNNNFLKNKKDPKDSRKNIYWLSTLTPPYTGIKLPAPSEIFLTTDVPTTISQLSLDSEIFQEQSDSITIMPVYSDLEIKQEQSNSSVISPEVPSSDKSSEQNDPNMILPKLTQWDIIPQIDDSTVSESSVQES